MNQRLGPVILGALGLAVAAWLGYAFGRGQSLSELARLYRDETALQYTIEAGDLVVGYQRLGGDYKPLIRTADGVALTDYSDWDYQANVIVDGQRYEMVRTSPSASVDYARNRIVAGLNGGDWLLSREITVDSTEAMVRFIFVANKPLHEVRVTIAHVDGYYLTAQPTDEGFTATVPRATSSEVESGAVRTPSYQVVVKAQAEGSAATRLPTELGLVTPYGVQSVLTHYTITDPPVGEYVPFAVERVSATRLANS